MQVEPLKLHSYSYDEVLHLCPRRYEIMQHWPAQVKEKIATEENLASLDAVDGNVDFAYGHAVHAGVQRLFLDMNLEQAIWEAYLAWNVQLSASYKSKTFWSALDAIHKAQTLVSNLKAEGWEVFYLPSGKPSIEINFLVHLIKGHKYQGHIDLILRHRVTGEYRVFEIKTTSLQQVDEAMYGNSSQPLGYSVILDTIAPKQVTYEVVYLIYSAAKYGREWHVMPFIKSKTQKAEWIKEVFLNIDQVETYKAEEHFPKRGAACYAFFRRCPYFGQCNLPLAALVPGFKKEQMKDLEEEQKYRGAKETGYDFIFDIEAIIANQLDILEI